MATIKSYTDIEQSRKLAEILPLESADMYYKYILPKSDRIRHNPEIGNPVNTLEWYNKGYTFNGKEPITMYEFCVPCWSLTALLSVLPKGTILLKSATDDTYRCDCPKGNIDKRFDNSVDACVAMVESLHELNEQKHATWSKEDERIYQSIIDDTVQENQLDTKQINWIKSIKDRMQH